MEEAEHALWREVGLSIAPREEEEVGFPRVSASFDFHRPLYFEDEFEIDLVVKEITAKTIRYSATVTSGDNHIATGSLTIICVRKKLGEPMKAIAIPDEIADRFQVEP